MGAMFAKFAAHFPFFYTYNFLQTVVPHRESLSAKMMQNAGIGFISSILSDSCANTFRVLKVKLILLLSYGTKNGD
jgi:hypothetical protein